jgi:hypothetical protein
VVATFRGVEPVEHKAVDVTLKLKKIRYREANPRLVRHGAKPL